MVWLLSKDIKSLEFLESASIELLLGQLSLVSIDLAIKCLRETCSLSDPCEQSGLSRQVTGVYGQVVRPG